MLKRLLVTFGAFALLWSTAAVPVLAINTTTGLNDAAETGGYSINQHLPQVVGGIINAILGILGVLFLCLTIYAGFLWMTAAGDDKKVAKAKSIITSAVVGLVLILSAYAIADFVTKALQKAG